MRYLEKIQKSLKTDNKKLADATRLAQRVVDLYTISKLLGRVNITIAQRYAHHCPESLRAGIAVLEKVGYNLTTAESSRNVSNA